MAKILIVDDDRSILLVAQAILEGGGHEVVSTTMPEEAVSLAIEHDVEAAVLDVMMPGKSGFAILTELRSRPETAKLPVLMLSKLGEGTDRVRGLRYGADDYMPKPLEPEELLLRLDRLLSLSASASAKLGGSLEEFSLQEMLHNLYNSSRAGTLHIESRGMHGTIDMYDGFLANANWAQLNGSDAVMAMMRLRQGRFRFEPAPALHPPLKSGDTIGSILDIVMNSAWIEDELYKRPGLRPHSQIFTAHEPGAPIEVSSDFKSLPLEETLIAVHTHQGIELLQLVETIALAPQRLCLAVAVLAECGLIQVDTTD